MSKIVDIAVIGGGAAGFFSAINAAELYPGKKIAIFEKSSKFLSKVKISGGGRCNVTHHKLNYRELLPNYPRGQKELVNVFAQFAVPDTLNWFRNKGVTIVAENDGRMFPASNDSQTIIDCLLAACTKQNISLNLNTDVQKITVLPEGFLVTFRNNEQLQCHKLIVACGGYPSAASYQWLQAIGHSIESPVPSLFTFNLSEKSITTLMGVSVPQAKIKINGSPFLYEGPLLVTHWGYSGPAVLKLSAFGARWLHEHNYIYAVSINWINLDEERTRTRLQHIRETEKLKKISNTNPFDLPKRLWDFFCHRAAIDADLTWANSANKQVNALLNQLLYDTYSCQGKTTYKEEFVTSGGIKRSEIDFKTMQSKKVKGLFFAGEIIDIDGITGGFNFQAAWSTGYVAAKNLFS
jgi:predicted Rossmann fold flavoprotein